jgi:8-oxo-dGTP pyrophosphatase MutT (NUDIX family)
MADLVTREAGDGLRLGLLRDLGLYRLAHEAEADTALRLAAFVESQGKAFERSCLEGHVTGSAFIVDPARTMTLFVHHRKLDKWLQPGGHCEAGESGLEAALREAREETGLTGRPLLDGALFDIDIHPIPARGSEPAHFHYDLRFLLEAAPGAELLSPESRALEWLSFAEAGRRNPEPSIARCIGKLLALFPQ